MPFLSSAPAPTSRSVYFRPEAVVTILGVDPAVRGGDAGLAASTPAAPETSATTNIDFDNDASFLLTIDLPSLYLTRRVAPGVPHIIPEVRRQSDVTPVTRHEFQVPELPPRRRRGAGVSRPSSRGARASSRRRAGRRPRRRPTPRSPRPARPSRA